MSVFTARVPGLASLMALATMLVSGLASAPQPAPPVKPSEPASSRAVAPGESVSQEEVVVTGSRIQRDEFTSASPVQVITSERSVLAGTTNTGQILQNASVAAGSGQINNTFGGFVVDGGPGIETISIRGLGAQRTLVLLNGRRLPPAGVGGTVGPVDLNIIPNSIISRVEILKDGASSIYGSDAIAGVANIITRTRLDGGEIRGTASGAVGGGDLYTVNGRYGWTTDRGGFSISSQIYQQRPLPAGDRDFLSCQQVYLTARQDGIVGGIPGLSVPTRRVAAGERTDAIDPRTGQFKCFTGGNAQGYVFTYSPVTGAFIGTRSNAPLLNGLTFAGANNNPVPDRRDSALQTE